MTGDFNGHDGEDSRGNKDVMGRFGIQDRITEGWMVVDFAKRMEMAVVNTFFQIVAQRWMTFCVDNEGDQ